MRSFQRPPLFAAASVTAAFLLATPASAVEPSTRVFGSATAAVLGGIVAGPVGLVAGAVIGYVLGPTITGNALAPRRRVARRAYRRVPVAAAEQAAPQPMYGQAYGQNNYGQPIYLGQQGQSYGQPNGQPMYLAQQVPAPGQVAMQANTMQASTMQPGTAPPPNGAMPGLAQPGMAPQTQAYVAPGIANRPAMYAPVPMPTQLAPSGNYAARAYTPQDGSQTPDPLH